VNRKASAHLGNLQRSAEYHKMNKIIMNLKKAQNCSSVVQISVSSTMMLLSEVTIVCLLSVLQFRPSERFAHPSAGTKQWTLCQALPFRSALALEPLVCLCKHRQMRTQKCALTSEIVARCPTFLGKTFYNNNSNRNINNSSNSKVSIYVNLLCR